MSSSSLSDSDTIVRAVSMIMGAVVGVTFLFGFGNVLNLALRLGVPPWVAPLVAPAVDLSVIGLLLGTRYLANHGATPEQLRPARRLLIFSSLVALALNVAEPLIAGQFGKAAFDAVGPLLLIGWAEVGPGLLAALVAIATKSADSDTALPEANSAIEEHGQPPLDEALLNRARQEDLYHWRIHRRPISSETLRKRPRIGAGKARDLVATVRSEPESVWTTGCPTTVRLPARWLGPSNAPAAIWANCLPIHRHVIQSRRSKIVSMAQDGPTSELACRVTPKG